MNLNTKISAYDEKAINRAVNRAIDRYIRNRRKKVPQFVRQYFSFKGAAKLHKKALGADLIKGPVNISWSLIYTILRTGGTILKKTGEKRVSTLLTEKLPHGFATRVQQEINWLIYTELLELPYQHKKRESKKDALMEEILNQPEIASLFTEHLEKISKKSKDPKFRKILESNLREYASSRTAAADLAGTIISLSVGASVFHKMTPGAMATGATVATAIAQHTAISNFFFGSTLGSIYYSIFPVSASAGLILATTSSIMAAMAIVTSFAGIITDPLQAKLGIHQRRLQKFINSLENELKGTGKSKFEIKDRYIARVFDILDLIKTSAMAVAK